MVGRIGKALRLEGEAGRLAVNHTAATHDGTVELAGIKLHPRLSGMHLQRPPARRIESTGREPRRRRLSGAQHEALIVPVPYIN